MLRFRKVAPSLKNGGNLKLFSTSSTLKKIASSQVCFFLVTRLIFGSGANFMIFKQPFFVSLLYEQFSKQSNNVAFKSKASFNIRIR